MTDEMVEYTEECNCEQPPESVQIINALIGCTGNGCMMIMFLFIILIVIWG